MGVIIDTSVLIAGERGAIRLPEFLNALGAESIAMSAVTASELLLGYHRADDAGIRARRAAFVDALIEAMPVLPFGLSEARRHAELWDQLLRSGTMIGPHDLLIAATALAQGYSLATLNSREFAHVRGLRLIPLDAYLM